MGTRVQHKPDFEQFLKVLKRQGKPSHLPLYEHIASPEFIDRRTQRPFSTTTADDPEHWRIYVDFWLGLGFDGIPMEIPLKCPVAQHKADAGRGFASEEEAVIHSMEDFEKYPWPEESSPIRFDRFEMVAKMLPEGVKIIGGVARGPYEWVSRMMGVMGLSYAMFDQPELVTAMFEKIGALIVSADRQLATMDAIGALRQGDDLGFKTSTFLCPEDLRRLVIPVYAKMAAVAHAAGKPFVLHSCGNLEAIYPDLIDAGVDAKHSFEETILPVEQFKQRYGQRITPLGGLDVDMICRGTEQQIRAYTRKKIEQCFADGHWALGTGNSLTDYMPVENYLIALDEGRRMAG